MNGTYQRIVQIANGAGFTSSRYGDLVHVQDQGEDNLGLIGRIGYEDAVISLEGAGWPMSERQSTSASTARLTVDSLGRDFIPATPTNCQSSHKIHWFSNSPAPSAYRSRRPTMPDTEPEAGPDRAPPNLPIGW